MDDVSEDEMDNSSVTHKEMDDVIDDPSTTHQELDYPLATCQKTDDGGVSPSVTYHELDDPPVTFQKRNYAVKDTSVTHQEPDHVVDNHVLKHQELDDPPATDQKPNDVVNDLLLKHQELDDPPATDKKTNDVVNDLSGVLQELVDPPATRQKPDDVVNDPSLMHQELVDPPATRQKPDDVVNDLSGVHQELDDPPATDQKPDDVVNDPSGLHQELDDPPATYQKPDHVVNDPAVMHQELDDPPGTDEKPDEFVDNLLLKHQELDDPPATRQKPDDVVNDPSGVHQDDPPATRQKPDDVVNDPSGVHQDDPPATRQKPDDVVNDPSVMHQELDHPPATGQKPDDVVNDPAVMHQELVDPPATCQKPDDVVNDPAVMHQELVDPPATCQKPDDVVNDPSVMHQELDDPPATRQKPDDVVNDPSVMHQELDDPPATRQKPDDVVNDPSGVHQELDDLPVTYQKPDDVVNDPSVMHQELVDPPATCQKPDDVVNDPAVMHQELVDPPATCQKPDDVVNYTSVMNQELYDSTATYQKPDDVVNDPSVIHQELDDPPATRQKPDDVVNDTSVMHQELFDSTATYQKPDDVVNDPSVIHQELDDPPATRQKPDDVVNDTSVMHQELFDSTATYQKPDDVVNDPSVIHQELDDPPATRQNPDDVVNDPSVMHQDQDDPPATDQKPDDDSSLMHQELDDPPETTQKPDDVVNDPSGVHQELDDTPATRQNPDDVGKDPAVMHQELDDSPATDQKPDDVVNDTSVMHQELGDPPATRQKPDDLVNDPSVMHQEQDDPPGTDQKPGEVVDNLLLKYQELDDAPATSKKKFDFVNDPSLMHQELVDSPATRQKPDDIVNDPSVMHQELDDPPATGQKPDDVVNDPSVMHQELDDPPATRQKPDDVVNDPSGVHQELDDLPVTYQKPDDVVNDPSVMHQELVDPPATCQKPDDVVNYPAVMHQELVDPPATCQKPDDVVNYTSVMHQELYDSTATYQKPDDVVNDPSVIHQELDDPPATRQKPDDVVNDTSVMHQELFDSTATYQKPDDVVNDPSVIHQELDDPPATRQKPDDVVNDPSGVHQEQDDLPVTDQKPDDVVNDPSVIHQELVDPPATRQKPDDVVNDPSGVHQELDDLPAIDQKPDVVVNDPSVMHQELDDPPATGQKPDDVVNDPSVMHQELDDPPATRQKPDDVVNDPSGVHQELDDLPATDQKPDDVVNDPSVMHQELDNTPATGQKPDDFVNDPSLMHQELVDPPATRQKPDDVVNDPSVMHQEQDNPPATFQKPDDVLNDPSLKHQNLEDPLVIHQDFPTLANSPINEEKKFKVKNKNDCQGHAEDNVKPPKCRRQFDDHANENAPVHMIQIMSDYSSQSNTGSEIDESSGHSRPQPLKRSAQPLEQDRQKVYVEQLMSKLHLKEKHQQLKTADFLQVTDHAQFHVLCAEEKFAQTFLQNLLMMDYRARCIKIEINKQNDMQRKDNESKDLSDIFGAIFEESLKPTNESNISDAINLMDAQMAVFHCADSFLKQLMVTKLSQCQFALPLLVPNPSTQQIEFPLWTFRQIKKSWRTSETFSKTQPVYKAETPMVAFFRLGSMLLSKSQLINSLINEKHNTFFHRNCPGSSRTRILMDGVVEIAWYCPSGEKTDTFPQCVAFCNLHGDAGDNEKQLDIITQMSSVNVVILPQLKRNDDSTKKLENFVSDSKPLICLLTENDSALTEIKKGIYKMGLKDRNQSDVFEELRTAVNNGLSYSESSSLFKLEDVAEQLHITVDEKTDEDCRRGKDAAQQMMSLLENKDLTEIKDSFLPCQGKLWHQWCQKNKELHRPTLSELHKSDNIEKNKSDKKTEMRKIHEQQQKCDLSQFIQIFIKELNSQKENEITYFLKWLGIMLDDFTTESLSALHHDYDQKWSSVLDLKKRHEKSQQLMNIQKELLGISEKLQAATFGLEHILREFGQIYESRSSVKNNKKNLKIDFRTLPGLAAKMMMSGFPLELMDGDAAHVPLIWVTAVLDELIKKLGDKRVFVLSVLGIQSSGKSTMLNAMFGLQFAVSAGRCTRGAFMQLVKVSEEMKMKKQLEFDYILVVDTEGLRALELAGRSTRNHDNELATFVVGLGNMTLINVFGENTAEMQDILQIVVQAFLRMKKIKLKPSCMFVHQNVSDITAGEKNMEGRRRLQEKLDEMTKLAAKEEDCNTECFSDVIAFDVQNDVKYFSQLWEGSPPMAPPNPKYSRNIQELKNIILSKASGASGITLSQFKMRIDDLWTALLNENFVFSFKNTLEISVYRKLETKYSDWTFSLRSAMLTIKDKFYNRIANANTEVKENDLIAEMRKTKEEVEQSLISYFNEDKDKEILCQWQGRFKTQIKNLHDDLVKGTKTQLNEAVVQKKARVDLDEKRTQYEKLLFISSEELALKLKSKGTDEHVLKEEFDTMWSKWVTEMTENIPSHKDFDLWDDVTQILNENNELSLINQRLNLKDFKQIDRIGNYDDYIILQKQSDDTEHSEEAEESSKKNKSGLFQQYFFNPTQQLFSLLTWYRNKPEKNILNAEYYDSVRQLIQKGIQESEKIMEKSSVRRQGYNVSYIQEITDCVKKSVQQHESENQTYKLKKEFIIDLCLYVCDIAIEKLTKHHKKFRETNDPRIYLEKEKTQYYKIFKNYCRGATTTTILIDFICSKLEPSILEAVYNKTAIDLAAQMRSDIRALCENRSNLEKHILKSLAEKDDFKQYIQYILQPKEHFKQFITTEVNKYFNENSENILNIFKGNLQQNKKIVKNAVNVVTEEVKNKRGDGNMWFRSFTKTLTDDLKFTGESCVNLTEVKDLDFLGQNLSISLNEMMIKLRNSFTSIDDIQMEKCRKRPDGILIDHFCQCCWVQCPFCKAICTNTMEDHHGDHSVPFHRNNGLNGWFYRTTTNLAISFCTTKVASDGSFYPNSSDDEVLWKEYRKGGPEYANWSITPDPSELPYWKWFVCRFQKDLEEYYNKTFEGCGEIPDEWKIYKKEDAIESLDKYM